MIIDKRIIPISLNGDMRRGGSLLQFRVDGDTDAVSRGLNVQVRGKSLAGASDAEWREFFNGHVIGDPDYRFSRFGSQLTATAGTIDALLRGEPIQDIGFTNQASPANDHQINGLNTAKMVNHILQKHCNVIYDADGSNGSPDGVITLTDVDTTNSIPLGRRNVTKSENMWATLQKLGGGEEGGGEFYRIYVTRKNKIVYQSASPFISPQPAAKGTLTKDLILGTVQVKLVNSQPGQRIGQVRLTAIKDSNTVYDALYPANPADGKILPPKDGVWANSQATADTQAERLYRWLTRLYTITVQVDPGLILFGDDGNGLDLGDRVLLTYDGPTEDADTGAGVHLNVSAQSMFVYGYTVMFDAQGRGATGTLILEHDNA